MKDKFYPDGYVKIYNADETELLFEGHNMIVQTGRDFIRSCFLSHLKYTSTAEGHPLTVAKNLLSSYFIKILLGSDGSATTLNMTALQNQQKVLDFETDTNIDFQNDHMKIRVQVEADANDDFVARELGIGLKTADIEDIILFSRISFDPIPVNASSKFTLEYYIYF